MTAGREQTRRDADGWGHMPRWKKAEREELDAAFIEWIDQHGLIWFDTDIRLRAAIAAALGVELVEVDG